MRIQLATGISYAKIGLRFTFIMYKKKNITVFNS